MMKRHVIQFAAGARVQLVGFTSQMAGVRVLDAAGQVPIDGDKLHLFYVPHDGTPGIKYNEEEKK